MTRESEVYYMKTYIHKHPFAICAIAVFMTCAFAFSFEFLYADTSSGAQTTDGVLVVYKDGTSTAKIRNQLASNDSDSTDVGKLDSDTKYAVADVPDDQTVSETVQQYEQSSIVEYAQPNHIYKMSSLNDNYMSYLWHFTNISAFPAITDYSAISRKVQVQKIRVAILDTGAYIAHEDLQTCLNKSLSVDITGSETGSYPVLTKDLLGHGTHVAGIVAATADNSLGVAGVGSAITGNNIDIIAENVFRNWGTTSKPEYGASDADIIKGLSYAVSNGAKVINMSLGGEDDYDSSDSFSNSPAVAEALDSCENSGVTVVCAAGNENSSFLTSPGDYKTCICVTATTGSNSRAAYSNYNAYKDIAAPGGSGSETGDDSSILSTYYSGSTSYAGMAGTSMASPVVTGIVAAMYSVNPNLTPSQIRSYLYSTATDLGTAGKDVYYGNGLVNADKALNKAASTKISSTVSFDSGEGSSVASVSTGYGQTISPLPSSTRYGYTFNGWYTSASGGTLLTTSTAIKDDVTYYAHWSKIVPRVTFSNGGPYISFTSATVDYGGTLSAFPSVKLRGYTFSGWYTARSGGTKFTTSTPIKNNLTLYARWNKVTVSRPNIRSAYSKSRRLYVSAYSISGAGGYQLQYSKYSTFKSSSSVGSTSSLISVGRFSKGTYYYVRMRAFKRDSTGGRVYGSWSSVKRVRIA